MILIIILAFISITTTVIANLLLKNAASSLGAIQISLATLPKLIIQIITDKWIISGLFILGIAFFTWILLLNKTKLNTMYPTIVSLQIILITLLSWLLFKESVSFFQVIGVVCIIIGIFFIKIS